MKPIDLLREVQRTHPRCRIHYRLLTLYKPQYCAWYCPVEGCEAFISDELLMQMGATT